MNPGKIFEQDFKMSCPEEILILRLIDSSYGANPCDFIVYEKPYFYMLELKSTKLKRLPKDMIRPKQLESMYHANKVDGVTAGFLVNLREVDNETYFLNGVDVWTAFQDPNKKSLSLKDIRLMGEKVESNKKRTRYRYNYEFLRRISK